MLKFHGNISYIAELNRSIPYRPKETVSVFLRFQAGVLLNLGCVLVRMRTHKVVVDGCI